MPTARQQVVQRLVMAGGLGLALALLLWPILSSGAVFAERDLITMHWPNRALLLRVWGEGGGLPTWNPYQALGLPLAANPHHAVWHPLTWLFFVLPFGLACNLQVLVPLVATAAGMLYLLRQMGVHRPAAVYGAIVWGLGGVALSLSNLLPVLLSVAPLPWAVACAHRARRTRGLGPLLGLAAAVALACAGGEPVSLVMLGASVLAVSWSERPSPLRQGERLLSPSLHVARVLGGASLGAGLAAVVLVPAAALFVESARAGAAALPEAFGWSLVPARLLEALVPPASRTLGEGADSLLWSSRLYAGREPFLYSLYLGCLLPPLAWVGLRRLDRAWALLGGVGLLLSLGAGLPLVARGLARVPLLGGLRFPEKWLVLAAFVAVVGAARGFDVLSAGESRIAPAVAAAVGGMALLAGVAALSVACGWPHWLAAPLGDAVQRAWHAGAYRMLGWQAALCAVVGGLTYWSGRRRQTALPALLIGLTALDLGVAGRPLLGFVPAGAVLEPPAFLRPLAGSGVVPRVFHAPCVTDSASTRARSLGCPPITGAWGIGTALDRDLDRTQPSWVEAATTELLDLGRADPGLLTAQLARRGVGAVVVEGEVAGSGGVGAGGTHLAVLPMAGARPEVFCPHSVVAIGEPGQWRGAVQALGAMSRDAVVLEKPLAAGVAAPAGRCTPGDVASGPGWIELAFEASGVEGAVIAVNRTWHPGWRARCDDRPVPVLRADLSLMAVEVPAGRHRLTLRYRDAWLEAGGGVSLLAFGACALLLGVEVRTVRRARRTAARSPSPPKR